MGKFFGSEKVSNFIRIGGSVAQLQSGSFLKIGGQGYNLASNLTIDTSVSGVGGLDIGSISANNYYYVYAVISSGTIFLVASLNSLAPTGFLSYRKVGAFNTEQGSSNIEQVLSFGEQPDSEVYVYGSNGNGSTNTFIARFSVLDNIKGLEIQYIADATLGDKFQCGKAGYYEGHVGFVDTNPSAQEAGVSINSDAFGTTFAGQVFQFNPELRFLSGRSNPTANLPENLAGGKFLNENDYLRVHAHGANVINNGSPEAYARFVKRGTDEIDWSI
jgi:hypothetical protein